MKLSICMMVKNEAGNLPRCLDSLQPLRKKLQSELIIVDTGSEDETVEIARRYTDKLFHHPWNDDFSAMRNISIGYATGEWVMIIDADEELEQAEALATYLQSKDAKQYAVVAIGVKNFVSLEPEEYSSMVSFRVFRRNKDFYYDGAVHNQPFFKGEQVALPEIALRHYGYLANDKDLMERKFTRTCGILKSELEKDPGNVYYWSQLSVTYAMHNDYQEAIQTAEKAYALLPTKKNANCMYVLIQLMAVYQHEGMYEKIITVAEESLKIKEGYLDIYYYYAEALAVNKKYEKAIIYFEKYFEMLHGYDSQTTRDVSLVEYTVGYSQIAYYNMSQICKEVGLYDRAIECAEKITDKKYKTDNMLNMVELYIFKGFYDRLTKFDVDLSREERNHYYTILSEKMVVRGIEIKQQIADAFSSTPNVFGLMCKMIVEAQRGSIDVKTKQQAERLTLEELPEYCSGIVYFLMKFNCSIRMMFSQFKENWINAVFERIAREYDDLAPVLQSYLETEEFSQSIYELKLQKNLYRYSLLLEKKERINYKQNFKNYLNVGHAYLQMVYGQQVLEERMVYELKNDEEVFLLYTYHALQERDRDRSAAIAFLQQALQAFSNMSKGIELLMQDIMSVSTAEVEMAAYKVEIKRQIEELIEQGKMAEAGKLIEEYSEIVPDDLEIVLLESQVILH